MAETQALTLEDLAQLLDTAGGEGDVYLPDESTVRWLVEQSETAQSLYAELVERPGAAPSLMELAWFLLAVTSRAEMPEAQETARWLIAQSEPARALHARIEQIAEDVGQAPIKPSGTLWVLEYERQLERLLLATDAGQSLDDLLDPESLLGIECEVLHRLCRARLERCRGEEKRGLEAVCAQLDRPAQLERLLPRPEQRFERLRQWLREIRDVGDAVESLEEVARLLRTVAQPE